jgi:hypothetical protein
MNNESCKISAWGLRGLPYPVTLVTCLQWLCLVFCNLKSRLYYIFLNIIHQLYKQHFPGFLSLSHDTVPAISLWRAWVIQAVAIKIAGQITPHIEYTSHRMKFFSQILMWEWFANASKVGEEVYWMQLGVITMLRIYQLAGTAKPSHCSQWNEKWFAWDLLQFIIKQSLSSCMLPQISSLEHKLSIMQSGWCKLATGKAMQSSTMKLIPGA